MHARRSLWIVVLVVFGLPALIRVPVSTPPPVAGYGDGSKPPGAPAFDPAPIARLQAVRPRYLFIGNSNTYTRIDEDHLAARVGAPVLVQARSGTSGVHWFLQLKNHVLASGVQPERVFVFFRRGELTEQATHRAAYRHQLSQPTEPDLAALQRCAPLGQRLEATAQRAIRWVWPLSEVRSDNLTDVADAVAPRWVFGSAEPYAFHERLNDRFGLGHLRRDVQDRLATTAASGDLACSVLPAMLALAPRVPLTLVHVQERTWPRDVDLEQLRAIADLANAHGVGWVDMAGDPAISPEWYGTSDHIAPAYERAWTEHFAGAVLDR